MKILRSAVWTALSLGVAIPSASALDTEYVPPEMANLGAEAERPDGWSHTLNLGAALQVSGSNRVPGQQDGATFTVSLHLAYDGELWRGNHELRLHGALDEAISRTPLIDEFVKASDNLEFEAVYYYHLTNAPWFGPFARASARTSLFQGFDVRAEEVTYVQDGEETVADRLQLTNSFSPTFLKQSVGVFARPISEETLALDIRLGAGARETIANGSYVLDDDADTDTIETRALQTYNQIGAEGAIELYGASNDLTYGANFEVLMPFYDSIDEDLDPVAATNYEVGANFGARLSSWASVQYEINLLKLPQVVDDWQVTNTLLLSFNYGIRRGVGAE